MALRETPLTEITLRKYERPASSSDRKIILTKFCMSLGLLQPGESRRLMVDVLEILLEKRNEYKNLDEIYEKVGKNVEKSGIRRHLRHLISLKLVERKNKKYRIMEGEKLEYIISFIVKKYLVDDIFDRINEYGRKLDELYE